MVKKSNISKTILKKLAGKQAVSFENLHKDTDEAKEKYAIARSIKNLTDDGLVECFNSEHKQYFRLTNEGKQKFNQISLEAESSLVSTEWDGYWRIILLDLPEERKSEREALRYLLKKAGFVCVKNSVWISMYPFEHLFTNIKNDLGLSTELMIIVTDKLDEKTKKEFFELCK
jgi:DNA-binding transcriptional regulator PaaX